MKAINVTYIISNINKALAFEWIAEELDPGRFNLYFILLNPGDSELERFLVGRGMKTRRVSYRGKHDLLGAVGKIAALLRREKTDVVHCHLFDACLAGLLAARLSGVKKRIYTRHHSTLHHLYFPRAVWYDRFINTLATHVVAISGSVKNLLTCREKVPAAKVRLIHHGFRLENFTQVSDNRRLWLQQKYNLTSAEPVVGVIARYTEWKGIQYIIPAFAQLKATYPTARLVLANAGGDYAGHIKSLLAGLPLGSYQEISFEADSAALYQLFDVFVHVPVNEHIEAFGQTYVEALAAGIPSVFTLSGVAPEFIVHEENALVVPFQDSASICTAVIRILQDEPLRNRLVRGGRAAVEKSFALPEMIRKLEELYAG